VTTPSALLGALSVTRAVLDLHKEPDAMTHPDSMQIRVTR
jgi:hypothetical protein